MVSYIVFGSLSIDLHILFLSVCVCVYQRQIAQRLSVRLAAAPPSGIIDSQPGDQSSIMHRRSKVTGDSKNQALRADRQTDRQTCGRTDTLTHTHAHTGGAVRYGRFAVTERRGQDNKL